MGTTTNNGWPTPVATDLVKDGWEAIKDLGDAIDTTLGVYAPSTPGLTLINTTSFSGVASQSISNFVVANYTHYKIILTAAGSTNLQIRFRFRENVTDKSTNYYGGAWYWDYLSNDGNSEVRNNGADASITDTKSGGSCNAEILYSVTDSGATGLISGFAYGDSLIGGYSFAYKCGATAITGFSIFPNTGTMTGSVSVYGFNK